MKSTKTLPKCVPSLFPNDLKCWSPTSSQWPDLSEWRNHGPVWERKARLPSSYSVRDSAHRVAQGARNNCYAQILGDRTEMHDTYETCLKPHT